MPTTTSTADLYARKSSADAGRSVGRQERAWRTDCAEEGITPGRVFVDPNFSASRYAKKARPDYEELIGHIRAHGCEMVALWEVTRGSRQMGEWVNFLDLCREKGVLIRVFGEDPRTFDPRRQSDRDALIREGMAAEGEVERMRARTRAGTADAAAQGRPPGPMPDGYKRIYGSPSGDSMSLSGSRRRRDIQQVVDEERAWIYRQAAQGVLNGVPVNTIARVLNAWGVPTFTGRGTWQGGPLMKALLNPALHGHRVLDGVVVTRNVWPAIIDPVTAARLRALREIPTGQRAHADTRLQHTLSGALLCGSCRRPMQGHARARGDRYECDPRRGGCGRVSGPLGAIDEVVSEMVVLRLRQPDTITIFQDVEDDSKMLNAQAELDALTGRRDELYAGAAKPGGPSMALVAAAERELLPRIEVASKRVLMLRTPPVLRGYDPVDLADRWGDYPVGVRRAVVLSLAEVVLSPVGRGGTWSRARLGLSRWRGFAQTWGSVHPA